jgi:hypothetical protein
MQRLVIALVTLIGLTGIAVVAAYLFIFAAGTDRAARLAPADTAFYANVYLQPSAGQQMNLADLIGRFPGFADDASLDDKVDQLVQNLLSGTGIDYRADLKPWLGDQLAVVVAPGEADPLDAQPVVIAEVKDRDAAESALPELAATDGGAFTARTYEGVELQVSADSTYAFVGEMVVIGPDEAAVEAVVDVQNGADALADRDDFARTMSDMPADHLAAAFVDLAAVAASAGAEEAIEGVSTAGAVLVAEPEGLRLSGSAPFTSDEDTASPSSGAARGSEPSSLVDWMPSDTIAEVVVFGLRQTLEDAEAALAETPEGEEAISTLDTFRALAAFGLGIDIDADLLPLLDREVAVALSGFDGELPSGQLLLRPEDPEAAAAALANVAERLTSLGAETTTETAGSATLTVVDVPDVGEVAFTESDGVIIIGLGVDDVVRALEAHESDASLGQNERYRTTFEVAGTRAGTEGWADVAALAALFGDAIAPDDDTRDILAQIGTFGFTAPSRDDEIEFHAVLTVDETGPD